MVYCPGLIYDSKEQIIVSFAQREEKTVVLFYQLVLSTAILLLGVKCLNCESKVNHKTASVRTLKLICWASSLALWSSALGLLLAVRARRAERMEHPHVSQQKSWDLPENRQWMVRSSCRKRNCHPTTLRDCNFLKSPFRQYLSI